MTVYNRPTQPSVVWDDVSPYLHDRLHDLSSTEDHSGVLAEAKVEFVGTGHNHSGGTAGAIVAHGSLSENGTYTHAQLDAHIEDTTNNPHGVDAVQAGAVAASKLIAVPQIENITSLDNSYYQIQQSSPMVLVGHNAGDDPNRFFSILDEDGTLLMDAGGNVIRIGAITSDQAGTISVVGQGYVAQPYIHLIDGASAAYIPNRYVRVRYGVEATVSTMPEDILLRESVWVGETDADLRNLIAGIKGDAFDAASAITLQDAKDNIDNLWGEVTGTGSSGTLVFTDTVIQSVNSSTETEKISMVRLDDVPETKIIRDVATFGRLANSETVAGTWNFSGGIRIEAGNVLPAPMEGKVFFKLDTKAIYAATDTEWVQSSGRVPGHFYKKNVAGQGTINSVTLVDALNNQPLDATKVIVYRGGILQSIEEGHYTLAALSNDVVVTFTTPVPEDVAVICKWFW